MQEYLNVYVAKTPFETDGQILCKARAEEIASCGSEKLRRQKYYVWKLLERAIRARNIDPESMRFFQKNGKWGGESIEFSLTHCDEYVAVAVSDLPVGVDMEREDPQRFLRLRERIFAEGDADEDTALLWTKKEAAFKRTGGKVFAPDKIATKDLPFASKRIGNYILTTVSERYRMIRYFEFL